jgi:RNA polymerase sigma-70 factor (ECF subfamily)
MARYAGGDDDSFGEVYDALAPRLHRFLMQQCRERTRAEDLVQQTFLRIHRARGSFTAGSRVVPWAFAIARRLMIDGFRAGAREQLGSDDELEHLPSPHSADEELHVAQLSRVLHRELARIPESQRVAFELVRQHGLPLADAAAALGVSVMAVKLRTHRASKALRAAIDALECGAA